MNVQKGSAFLYIPFIRISNYWTGQWESWQNNPHYQNIIRSADNQSKEILIQVDGRKAEGWVTWVTPHIQAFSTARTYRPVSYINVLLSVWYFFNNMHLLRRSMAVAGLSVWTSHVRASAVQRISLHEVVGGVGPRRFRFGCSTTISHPVDWPPHGITNTYV